MKVIIAGSRSVTDYNTVVAAINAAIIGDPAQRITQVVSGTCHGVDRLGERWARENDIPIASFPADWNQHGTPPQ